MRRAPRRWLSRVRCPESEQLGGKFRAMFCLQVTDIKRSNRIYYSVVCLPAHTRIDGTRTRTREHWSHMEWPRSAALTMPVLHTCKRRRLASRELGGRVAHVRTHKLVGPHSTVTSASPFLAVPIEMWTLMPSIGLVESTGMLMDTCVSPSAAANAASVCSVGPVERGNVGAGAGADTPASVTPAPAHT